VTGTGGLLERRRDGGAESKQTSAASPLSSLNAEDVGPWDEDSGSDSLVAMMKAAEDRDGDDLLLKSLDDPQLVPIDVAGDKYDCQRQLHFPIMKLRSFDMPERISWIRGLDFVFRRRQSTVGRPVWDGEANARSDAIYKCRPNIGTGRHLLWQDRWGRAHACPTEKSLPVLSHGELLSVGHSNSHS